MKICAQEEGIFICGKIKEVRLLLSAYTSRYRTVKELIGQLLN
jgi:hypothetical protein